MGASRFISTNRCVDPTTSITALTELTNRPGSYLRDAARWRKWRSATTTGSQNVEFEFATLRLIQGVALVDWKAHTGGSIRADYWDGDSWETFGSYTLPSDNPTKTIVVWDATGKNTTGIRVFFTNTTAASDYVELGVVVAGAVIEPARSIDVDFSMSLVDQSEIVRAMGGQSETQVRPKFHVASGVFNASTEADLSSLRTMKQSLGTGLPFLFSADSALANETFYARLVDMDLPRMEDRGDVARCTIEVEEQL